MQKTDWYSNYLLDIIKKTKALNVIVKMLNMDIPIKLMLEILKPYMCKKNYNKAVISTFFKDACKVFW